MKDYATETATEWKCLVMDAPAPGDRFPSVCGNYLVLRAEPKTLVGPREWLVCPVHGAIAGRPTP